ncbi:hypothetical protein Q3G72_019019 [Acer saccharum]|nr:hypothetical protein Q3G72_019019 [Acer saccharum]
MLRCLQFARETGLTPSLIKSDAQVVVNIVNSKLIPCSDIVIFIRDISLLLDGSSCKVAFVSRRANMAAYCLVKMGLTIESDRF